MNRTLNHYLIKINRWTGWCLIVLVPLLFITGYGITGDYDWAVFLASAELHAAIHQFLIPYAIAAFIIHGAINIHFALKRRRNKQK